MLTKRHRDSIDDLPATLSKISIIRAHQKYQALFDIIGPAQINVTIDPPFLSPDKQKFIPDFSGKNGSILICPLLLLPLWECGCDAVLSDAGRVYKESEGCYIKERDYALLNELKWFLIYKHATDQDWEGSAYEARMVATLKIFAMLIRLHYDNPEYSAIFIGLDPEEYDWDFTNRDKSWDYFTFGIKALFDSTSNQPYVPAMEPLLEDLWDNMVKAAKTGNAGTHW